MFRLLVLAAALGATPNAVAGEAESRETELLARVAERDPALHDRLMALKTTDPSAYLAQLARLTKISERYHDDPAFAARVDQITSLEEQVRDLAVQWAAAAPGARPGIRAQMAAASSEVFELKQAERRKRIVEYQERLDRLEAEVSEIEAKRAEVIERWVNQALAR